MKKKRAFTLIETLVVLVIIGLIVLVAVPNFNNFYQMYKFRSAMNQLVIDIRAARQLALTQNRPVKITPIDVSKYPQAGNSIVGYAIYVFNGPRINSTAANPNNWREAAPGQRPCGQVAERPRFLPNPVSFVPATGPESAKSLKDIDEDGYFDIVFEANGQFYEGPYPASSGEKLTFSSDPDNPLNNTPRIILKTNAKVAKNRYLIHFSLSGKVGVEPYRE